MSIINDVNITIPIPSCYYNKVDYYEIETIDFVEQKHIEDITCDYIVIKFSEWVKNDAFRSKIEHIWIMLRLMLWTNI